MWERRGPSFFIYFCLSHSSIPVLRPGLVCCAEQGKAGKTGHWQQLPVQVREGPGAPHIPGRSLQPGALGRSDTTVMGTRETWAGCKA